MPGGKIHKVETGTDYLITLDADSGTISAGGKYQGAAQLQGVPGQSGELRLWDESGNAAVYLSSKPRHLFFRAAPAGQQILGTVMVFVDAETPDLRLFGSSGDMGGEAKDCTVHLRGSDGVVRSGGKGVNGRMLVLGADVKARFGVEGSTPELYLSGSSGTDNGAAGATVHLRGSDGVVRAGGNGVDGDLFLLDQSGKARVHFSAGGKPPSNHTRVFVNGLKGDIVCANGDCAEEFDIADSAEVDPGTVMVIDTDGKLQTSVGPYDTKVAGVISGDGESGPAIVLGRKESQYQRVAVALAGRVSCKVDAQYGSIRPGDLLVTSPTPGHAMKAGDPDRAFGAVVGKALQLLSAGQGLIPVLVALQ